MLDLISSLEEKFNIKINDKYITENFENYSKIKKLIEKIINEKNKNKVFIIAEIGPNHNGSYLKAKKMIEKISKTGADAVKFQFGNPNEVYSENSIMAKYQKNDNSKSIIEMSIKNQLSLEEHIKLSQICIKKYFICMFRL